jgi:hypothetical protein
MTKKSVRSYIEHPAWILFASLALLSFEAGGVGKAACECPTLTCSPCEREVGTHFYSEKCKEDLSKVLSCKKPRCEPVENQKQCLARTNPDGAQAPSSSEISKSADIGSAEQSENPDQPMAFIRQVSGSAQLMRVKGRGEIAREGLALHKGDSIETTSMAKVKVRLNDSIDEKQSSEFIVNPNSRVVIEHALFEPQLQRRAVLLNLLRGKLRSRVNQPYDGPNSFRVRTRTSVAGVRGTDFITTFEMGEREWRTEVQTLTGRVQLKDAPSIGNGGDDAFTKAVEVTAGTVAAFVIKTPASEAELEQAISNGTMEPALKIKPEDFERFDETTDLRAAIEASQSVARAPASATTSVCAEPVGDYNQCSWTCEGPNPTQDPRCRTDLPGVACVRRLCRANGVWADPKTLPKSQSDLCRPSGPIVKSCESYW